MLFISYTYAISVNISVFWDVTVCSLYTNTSRCGSLQNSDAYEDVQDIMFPW
jgi:hypothetical protein